jgi:YidC/Oxa1 family membrane protein insertase
MPLFFAFSGINFPIGVLLYWLTTNVWSRGQQFYTIRRMPAPGSPAEKALEARRIKSGKEHKKFTIPGLSHDTEPEEVQDSPVTETKPKPGNASNPSGRTGPGHRHLATANRARRGNRARARRPLGMATPSSGTKVREAPGDRPERPLVGCSG